MPVYTFGESDTYKTFTGFKSIRLWLNKYNIPAVVFWGEWWIPLFPKSDCKVVTVFGEPIAFPKIEEPTKEDVDKYHKVYMEKLVEMFENEKEAAGFGDRILEIY